MFEQDQNSYDFDGFIRHYTGWIIGFIIVSVGILICVSTWYGTQAKYITLDETYKAAFDKQTAVYDQVYTTLKLNFNLKEDFREDFDKFLDAYVQATVGRQVPGQATVAQLTQAHMPDMPEDFYKQLSSLIEDSQAEFTDARDYVIRATEAHNNYVRHPWRKLFLSKDQKQVRESGIITSGEAKQAAETGEHNLDKLN